ncbi:MAG: hypothetical protein CFE34_13970 [Rhodobacteraceae bacterium PARR1]|nr:MAG: hypothetical protein CFE34_13970 [Rhodobacteraceae bacterium PARR1]
MDDEAVPADLVHRLHVLRARNALTIQEMADQCGLPKSSLESYMRLEGARRPGLDALVAIGSGMDVSLDWLVGRASDSFDATATKTDYAMACFRVVSSLIVWMRQKQSTSPDSIFGDETVAGIEDAEVAAKAMLVFGETVERFRNTHRSAGEDRAALHHDLVALLEREVGTK